MVMGGRKGCQLKQSENGWKFELNVGGSLIIGSNKVGFQPVSFLSNIIRKKPSKSMNEIIFRQCVPFGESVSHYYMIIII